MNISGLRCFVFCLCTLLFGCTSAPRYSFYRLDVSGTVTKLSERSPGTILVTRLQSSGFAADRPINFRESDDALELKRYRYKLWSEQPARMIHDGIVSSLRQKNLVDYVITPAERATADWIVSGKLHKIEHVRTNGRSRVAIELELGMASTGTRRVVFLDCYHAQEPVAASGNADGEQIEDVIEAFNSALRNLLIRFANDTAKALLTKKSTATSCGPAT